MIQFIGETTILILQSLSIVIAFSFVLLGIQLLHAKVLLNSRLIYLTAWLGTPIHEISHAILCFTFGHRIMKLALFKPNTNDGTLGFVTHGYNPANAYHVIGNFFIGIAPLAGGIAASYAMTYYFLPLGREFTQYLFIPEQMGVNLESLQATILNLSYLLIESYKLDPVKTVIWVYAVACISLHMVPSYADIKGGFWGGVFIIMIMAILRFMAEGISDTILAYLYYYSTGLVVGFTVCSVLALTLAFSTFILQLLVLSVSRLFGRHNRRPHENQEELGYEHETNG